MQIMRLRKYSVHLCVAISGHSNAKRFLCIMHFVLKQGFKLDRKIGNFQGNLYCRCTTGKYISSCRPDLFIYLFVWSWDQQHLVQKNTVSLVCWEWEDEASPLMSGGLLRSQQISISVSVCHVMIMILPPTSIFFYPNKKTQPSPSVAVNVCIIMCRSG